MAHVTQIQGAAGSFVPMASLLVETVAMVLDGLRTLTLNPVPFLMRVHARNAERRHLAELDDRLLADMGLDRNAVQREADKTFWQA